MGGRERGLITAIWPLLKTVSMGSRMPSSKTWDTKVAMVYIFGVRSGSIPNRERRNRGVDADIRVGRVEWRKVTGAMERGNVQEGRDCRVGTSERGGCVEGVSISFVRAMSIGARTMPAIPAALTAANRLAKGDGEDRTSMPPTVDGVGIRAGVMPCSDIPGSGRASKAQRRERTKEVIVERMMEWMKVLFAPFQIPQAPSLVHKWERTMLIEEVEGRL